MFGGRVLGILGAMNMSKGRGVGCRVSSRVGLFILGEEGISKG